MRLTRKLLHELAANAEQHAIPELLLAILEECCPRAARRSFSLFVDSIFDLCGFPAQVGFVAIQLSSIGMETSEDDESFIGAVVRDQPKPCQ